MSLFWCSRQLVTNLQANKANTSLHKQVFVDVSDSRGEVYKLAWVGIDVPDSQEHIYKLTKLTRVCIEVSNSLEQV